MRILSLIILYLISTGELFPADKVGAQGDHTSCIENTDFFAEELWPKVGAKSCIKCHKAGGDAEDSRFVLMDPDRDPSEGRSESLAHNREAFTKVAGRRKNDGWLVLLKSTNQIEHEGEDVLDPDSPEFRLLRTFVLRVNGESEDPGPPVVAEPGYEQGPFWNGVTMIDDRALLRRLTLSLASRLPTNEELKAVKSGGLGALEQVLDQVLKEDAFLERLAEGFNDILLIRGYDGNGEEALSYDHFEKTRLWYQKHDLSHAGDEKAQQQARYKLAREYREALLREPLEMIKHIVSNDRPFSEIVTGDFIMMSPYTSRGYGMYEEIKDRFKDTEDPYEYVPVRLNALTNRAGKVQESDDGFYPHSGIISTFQYLKRFPTTETNRNRLRVRMFYQHFLGIDVMQLAPRVNDAAAITAKYEVPTMEAADCVVCHKLIDPVAGVFQDYYALDGKGIFQPRKEGWYEDMFGAGFEGEDMPADERWRGLQWLGERTADDPRFAVAMVEHVYYIMTGRRPLLAPEDLEDPFYHARLRAHQELRAEIEKIARRLRENDFNLKEAFKGIALSPFYRAEGLDAAPENEFREAELADIGVVRMLAPEQLERKLEALFGHDWGSLNEKFLILYGGIDSREVTERLPDPSGAMGSIQRMMANDMSIKTVGVDFSRPKNERRLFPAIEPSDVPDGSAEVEKRIRGAIVHLQGYLLGRYDDPDSEEVTRIYDLFSGIVAEAEERKFDKMETWFVRDKDGERIEDPNYTIRAWRGVLTYLLRQQEFLYE